MHLTSKPQMLLFYCTYTKLHNFIALLKVKSKVTAQSTPMLFHIMDTVN